MKTFILSCLFMGFIAVTLADEKPKIMEISKACLAESKATEQEIKDYWGPSVNYDSTSPNMKCQVKCVMEKMGHFKDGVFDADKAAESWKGGNKMKHLMLNDASAFTKCKAEKGENDCETAFKVSKCLRTFKA